MLPLFIPLTVTVLVAQLCPMLCDPVDYSSPPLLSMEFSWQEYWSYFPYPSPGHLPDPGIKLKSLTSPALAGGFFTIFTTRATWEASEISIMKKIKWSGMTVIEAGKGGQHSVLISV